MFISVTFERRDWREKPRGKLRVKVPSYTPIFNSEWDSWRFSKLPCPETANQIAAYLVSKAVDRLDCRAKDLKLVSYQEEVFE